MIQDIHFPTWRSRWNVDRRSFLVGSAVSALTAAHSAHASARRALPPLYRPEQLPLVDFHTHLQKRVDAAQLISLMDANGVARLVLMPLYYGDRDGTVNDGEGSDEQALEFAQQWPGRFVPFVGMQRYELGSRDRWLKGDQVAERLLASTEAKLASGHFFGMGEFMFRFYPYRTELGINAPSDMKFPPDSWLFHRFATLSARFGVPMVFHCEAEPEFSAQVVRVIEQHPKAIFIWAHNCGRQSASSIDALMTRFPNLYADLGGMMYTGGMGYGSYWPRRTEWMHLIADGNGQLVPEMKALFEKFPDRYLIGTDTAHARVYDYYTHRILRWRFFLPQLSASAARKIAFENAERLFAA